MYASIFLLPLIERMNFTCLVYMCFIKPEKHNKTSQEIVRLLAKLPPVGNFCLKSNIVNEIESKYFAIDTVPADDHKLLVHVQIQWWPSYLTGLGFLCAYLIFSTQLPTSAMKIAMPIATPTIITENKQCLFRDFSQKHYDFGILFGSGVSRLLLPK